MTTEPEDSDAKVPEEIDPTVVIVPDEMVIAALLGDSATSRADMLDVTTLEAPEMLTRTGVVVLPLEIGEPTAIN